MRQPHVAEDFYDEVIEGQDPLLGYAGQPTFLRAPQGSVEDLKAGMIAIVGVSYDLSTAGRVGARWAPMRMRTDSRQFAGIYLAGSVVEIVSGAVMLEADRSKLLDLGDLGVYPTDWPRTEAALRSQMHEIARRGAIPVVLGGDHLITYPLVQGFHDGRTARGDKNIGYIQFSGNLDLGQGGLPRAQNHRGGTARRILESQAVNPKNMVWVGVKGYQPSDEVEMVRGRGLRMFTLADIRSEGIRRVTEKAVEIAGSGCDAIYASVDFDIMDGAFVPGTATPSFRGIRNVDLQFAVDVLAASERVMALDIVGVNPLVEMTTETAQRFGAFVAVHFVWPHIRMA